MARKNPDAKKVFVLVGSALAMYVLYTGVYKKRRRCGPRCQQLRNINTTEHRRKIYDITNAPRIADVQRGRI